MKLVAVIMIAGMSVSSWAAEIAVASGSASSEVYATKNSPSQVIEVKLDQIKGLEINQKGIRIRPQNSDLINAGLVDYFTTGGVCLGMSMAASVGFDAGFANGDLVKKAAKEYLDINHNENGMYICITNSGIGIVNLGEKLKYFGARANATGAYSMMLAIGFDPNLNALKIIGRQNETFDDKAITLYGPQVSLGLGKMPNASVMCGSGPERGLLCQAELGTGVGYGVTLGYSKDLDL